MHGVGLFRGRKGATELSETLAAAFEGSVSFVETLLFSANGSRGCCSYFCVRTKSCIEVIYIYVMAVRCVLSVVIYMCMHDNMRQFISYKSAWRK